MIRKPSGIKIEKFSPALGAIITGVDLSKQINDEQFEDIFQAFVDYQVLFFKDQNVIPPEQHVLFGKRFGPLHAHPAAPTMKGQPEIFEIHTNNTYVHNFGIDGKISYVKKYNDESLFSLLVSWNAWEPEKVFFESMLNSGKLLEIKNKKLRKEIESIYTKQQERVNGMAIATKNNTDMIADWLLRAQNTYNSDINSNETFAKLRDQELKNLLKVKSAILSLRISDLENYLQAIQNVVLLISSEYKKLD